MTQSHQTAGNNSLFPVAAECPMFIEALRNHVKNAFFMRRTAWRKTNGRFSYYSREKHGVLVGTHKSMEYHLNYGQDKDGEWARNSGEKAASVFQTGRCNSPTGALLGGNSLERSRIAGHLLLMGSKLTQFILIASTVL